MGIPIYFMSCLFLHQPDHHIPAFLAFSAYREDRITMEHSFSDDHLVINFIFLHSSLKGRGTGIQCLIAAVDEGGFRSVRKVTLLQPDHILRDTVIPMPG